MSKKKETKKSTPKEEKARVNPQLEGFDVSIDPFGEIKSSFTIDKINEFLNKNVEDKKLKDRPEDPAKKKKK
jgi:hypothetical protein